MAVTYEYVGKTGGGMKVNRIDVPNYSTSEASRNLVTVPIPEGVSAKVAIGFDVAVGGGASGNSFPDLGVGNQITSVGGVSNRRGGGLFDATGPTVVRHIRNSTLGNYTMSVSNFVVLWWEE